MSIEHIKNKTRKQLYEIAQIQADAYISLLRESGAQKAKIAELEKQLKEGEALVIELVAALKDQHKSTN